jgi:hypothetical protein
MLLSTAFSKLTPASSALMADSKILFTIP